MSQVEPIPAAEQDIEISTILSSRVLIPIACDDCNQDTDIPLAELCKLALVRCQHCGNERRFTETELRVTRMVLADAGFHFSL